MGCFDMHKRNVHHYQFSHAVRLAAFFGGWLWNLLTPEQYIAFLERNLFVRLSPPLPPFVVALESGWAQLAWWLSSLPTYFTVEVDAIALVNKFLYSKNMSPLFADRLRHQAYQAHVAYASVQTLGQNFFFT